MNRTKLRTQLAFLKEMRQNPPPYHTDAWRRLIDRSIADIEERLDPRLGLTRRFPSGLQPALTWLTGKAGDETPLRHNTGIGLYLGNLAQMFGATGLAAAFIYQIPGANLPMQAALGAGGFIALLAACGAVRAGTSTFLHHSTHGNFAPPAWWVRRTERKLIREGKESGTAKREARESWNRMLGELVSALTLVAPFDLYRRDHRVHHSQALATWDDPDWRFLFRYGGFRPGRSVRSYWMRLFRTLLSPRFHGRFLRSRLHDNLLQAETPLLRRLTAWGVVGGIGALTAFATLDGHTLLLLALALWLLVIGPLNQAGALLQLLSEHRWQRMPDSTDRKVVLARKTRGRFVSPPLPQAEWLPARWLQWGIWWLRTTLWHLPVERLWVWPADLGSHDWHHRQVGSPDWPNSAYARRADIAAGTPGWEEPYQEDVWGLKEALEEVFALLNSLPPYDGPNDLPPGAESNIFRTM